MSSNDLTITQLMNLSGKTAIVTGGAKGIGLAISRRLSEAGAALLIADMDETAAKEAAGELNSNGKKAIQFRCDVSKDDDIKNMVAYAVQNMGGIDILVNNAGIYPRKALAETTGQDFNEVIGVNLTGTFSCSRYVSNRMIEQGKGGCIVNLASIEAMHPASTGMCAYQASKAGVAMLTKSLAKELSKHDIRVNAVAPGGIKTGGIFTRLDSINTDRKKQLTELKEFMGRIILGRMGTPDEIARVVLFLTTEMSSYLTGTLIVADGGYLIA